MNIPIVQLLAYAVEFLLIVCAGSVPQLRAYVAVHLTADLARLFADDVVGERWARLIDAPLLLVPLIALAVALRVSAVPLSGVMSVVVVAAYVDYSSALGAYLAAYLVSYVYIVGASTLSSQWRDSVGLGDALLLACSAVGLVGTVVARAWPDQWVLLNISNTIAQSVLCVVCVALRELDKR